MHTAGNSGGGYKTIEVVRNTLNNEGRISNSKTGSLSLHNSTAAVENRRLGSEGAQRRIIQEMTPDQDNIGEQNRGDKARTT